MYGSQIDVLRYDPSPSQATRSSRSAKRLGRFRKACSCPPKLHMWCGWENERSFCICSEDILLYLVVTGIVPHATKPFMRCQFSLFALDVPLLTHHCKMLNQTKSKNIISKVPCRPMGTNLNNERIVLGPQVGKVKRVNVPPLIAITYSPVI